MNTHNFIHKIFILSFLSIVHSYIKSTILNTCKQIYGLVLIETYIVTHVYIYKKRQAFHITLYICKCIVNKNCFWLLFDLFQTISETELFGPTCLNKMKSTKIFFECFFLAQNPFQTILGLRKILEFFSQKFEIFVCFDPLYCMGEKMKLTKNHFWVLFHSAESIPDHFSTQKNFGIFFSKIFMFRPLCYLGEKKWSQQKIAFECSFIAQNPFQTILGLWKTLKKFRKSFWNLCVSTPILHRWKKVKSTKNHFWVLFHSAKSNSDNFRTLKNWKIFEKIFENFWNFFQVWGL